MDHVLTDDHLFELYVKPIVDLQALFSRAVVVKINDDPRFTGRPNLDGEIIRCINFIALEIRALGCVVQVGSLFWPNFVPAMRTTYHSIDHVQFAMYMSFVDRQLLLEKILCCCMVPYDLLRICEGVVHIVDTTKLEAESIHHEWLRTHVTNCRTATNRDVLTPTFYWKGYELGQQTHELQNGMRSTSVFFSQNLITIWKRTGFVLEHALRRTTPFQYAGKSSCVHSAEEKRGDNLQVPSAMANGRLIVQDAHTNITTSTTSHGKIGTTPTSTSVRVHCTSTGTSSPASSYVPSSCAAHRVHTLMPARR